MPSKIRSVHHNFPLKSAVNGNRMYHDSTTLRYIDVGFISIKIQNVLFEIHAQHDIVS